jgi:hypothetical protein
MPSTSYRYLALNKPAPPGLGTIPIVRPRSRLLLNAATLASLLLCAATTLLWIRSYRVGEWFGYSHVDPPGRPRAIDWGFHVTSGNGRLALAHHRDLYDDPATIARQRRETHGGRWFAHSGGAAPSAFMARNVPTVLGVGIGVRHNLYPYGRNDNWILTVPHALLATPPALIAALGLRRWWRDRPLHRPGHCPHCGYDLRATPARCPECGTPAPPLTPAPSPAA